MFYSECAMSSEYSNRPVTLEGVLAIVTYGDLNPVIAGNLVTLWVSLHRAFPAARNIREV
jgi:hypothetical protein